MGIKNSSLPLIQLEEEAFNTILNNLKLTQIEVKSAYKEFMNCLDENGTLVNTQKMKFYLKKITGHKILKKYQKNYFHKIINDTAYNQSVNIRILGFLILTIAKGSETSKIELFIIHYFKYYIVIDELTVKDFIRDFIDVNTDKCLESFSDYLSAEALEKFRLLYSDERKEKLINLIFSKFDEIEIKNLNSEKNKKENYLDEEDDQKFDFNKHKLIMKGQKQMYKVYNENKESSFKCLNQAQQAKFKEFLINVFDQLKGENIRLFLEKECQD